MLEEGGIQQEKRSGGELPVKRKYWLPSLFLGVLVETCLVGGRNVLRQLLNIAALSGGFAFGFWAADEFKSSRARQNDRSQRGSSDAQCNNLENDKPARGFDEARDRARKWAQSGKEQADRWLISDKGRGL